MQRIPQRARGTVDRHQWDSWTTHVVAIQGHNRPKASSFQGRFFPTPDPGQDRQAPPLPLPCHWVDIYSILSPSLHTFAGARFRQGPPCQLPVSPWTLEEAMPRAQLPLVLRPLNTPTAKPTPRPGLASVQAYTFEFPGDFSHIRGAQLFFERMLVIFHTAFLGAW